jgi:hypothetical protein
MDDLPIITPHNKRTKEEVDQAKSRAPASFQLLQRLSHLSRNKGCADCTAPCTFSIVLPYGIFVCFACAQAHHRLGRHISQVKELRSPCWFPDELKAVEDMGNARAQRMFRGPGAPGRLGRKCSLEERVKLARQVYGERKWLFWGIPRNSPLPSTTGTPRLDFFESFGIE